MAEKIKMEKKAALEAKRQHEELLNGKQKKIILLSEKSKRIHPDLYPKKRKTWGKKKLPPKPVLLSADSVKEAAKKPENSDKVLILSNRYYLHIYELNTTSSFHITGSDPLDDC